MTTRLAPALAGLLFLIAGCTGSSPSSRDDAAGPATVSPDSEFGLITGRVTDAEARPIADVEAGLRGTGLLTTSDASGYFQFANMKPDKYVLDVARLGFTPVARELEVKAGEEIKLDIQLAPVAIAEEAYFESNPFSGFLECALGAVVWVSPCSYPYTAAFIAAKDGYCVPDTPACAPAVADLSKVGPFPSDLQPNKWRYNFTVQPGAVEVVSEMAWSPSSAAATKLHLVISCAQYDPILDDCSPTYSDPEGQSPLRGAWKTTPLGLKDKPVWVMSRTYLPFFDPQVALQQRFEVWNSVWYNQAAPENWSILNEGK